MRMVLGLCLGLCVRVCLSVRHHESCDYAQLSVQPKVPTASAQYGRYAVFSLFKSYAREKANKLKSMCLPRHHMAPMERDISAFSGSFKV